MNISLNWLSEYVDVSMPLDELAKLFTRIGLNFEGAEETPADLVLDLEVASNRPDCLGHLGVARELAAATGAKFTPPDLDKVRALRGAGKAADLTSVEVHDPDLCPRYTARVIRGVKVAPSPRWLVERLEAMGLRSVNNVVDATNYVLFEYSQPLHCFDHDKLAEGRIVVRRARDGEQLVSIDETACELDDSMLVIADAEKPVAIAGVMGGLNTEVGERTVNVLIESAQFDPLNIRRTSRKLALMSESNYRFERGVDPVGVDDASLRACGMIIDLAGGEPAEGVVDVWACPYEAPTVTLRPARTCALLGFETPPQRQVEILERLGLSPKVKGGTIACTIPPHRADLRREADLIEEVARMVGYDEIPVSDKVVHEVVAPDRARRIRGEIARVLSAAGFDEAVTFAFVDAEESALFGVGEPVCVDLLSRRTNNALRPTLLPSLLRACKTNQDAGTVEVDLYELAGVFPPAASGKLPREHIQLAMVTTRELRALRGAVEALCRRVAPSAAPAVRPAPVPGMGADASAEILLGDRAAGVLGQVDEAVLDYYGLEHPIAAATIRLDALDEQADMKRAYRPVGRFPAVRRDLSLIVDEGVSWAQITDVLSGVVQALRTGVEYVTTYRGKPIEAGRKSVTLTLIYQWSEGTLRSGQIDEQVGQVVSAMKKNLGAELRA